MERIAAHPQPAAGSGGSAMEPSIRSTSARIAWRRGERGSVTGRRRGEERRARGGAGGGARLLLQRSPLRSSRCSVAIAHLRGEEEEEVLPTGRTTACCDHSSSITWSTLSICCSAEHLQHTLVLAAEGAVEGTDRAAEVRLLVGDGDGDAPRVEFGGAGCGRRACAPRRCASPRR